MSTGSFDNKLDKKLLGEVLVSRNLVTEDQLNKALEVQRLESGFLGEVLIRLGFVQERDIVVALVIQCNLPYIAINKYSIGAEVIALVPFEFAQKHCLIPLDRVGDVLSVVMADPLNIAIKSELQRITNCRIAPFIATKSEIEQAIDRWFNTKE
jgi:type IV pilus assembly protein PilB